MPITVLLWRFDLWHIVAFVIVSFRLGRWRSRCASYSSFAFSQLDRSWSLSKKYHLHPNSTFIHLPPTEEHRIPLPFPPSHPPIDQLISQSPKIHHDINPSLNLPHSLFSSSPTLIPNPSCVLNLPCFCPYRYLTVPSICLCIVNDRDSLTSQKPHHHSSSRCLYSYPYIIPHFPLFDQGYFCPRLGLSLRHLSSIHTIHKHCHHRGSFLYTALKSLLE